MVAILPPMNGGRLRVALGESQKSDAAIGGNRAEDQFEQLLQELRHIKNMADGLTRFVQDGEIGELALQPWAGFLGLSENAAAFRFADRLDNGRSEIAFAAGDQADAPSQIADGRGAARFDAVNKQSLADADMIAHLEDGALNALVVDKGAIGAAQIVNLEAPLDGAEFGMAARNFGIVQANPIRGIATDADDCIAEFEVPAFVVPLQNEQSSHASPDLGQEVDVRPPESRYPAFTRGASSEKGGRRCPFEVVRAA